MKIYIVLVINQPFQFTSATTHTIALLNSLALGVHANCFVRLRNLGKAYGVIVSAAAVTKSYKRTHSLKLTAVKIS